MTNKDYLKQLEIEVVNEINKPRVIDNKTIYLEKKVKFGGFDRARTRFGACRFRRKSDSTFDIKITISKPLALANKHQHDIVQGVILHEIAHAIDLILYGNSSGHGERWKRIARQIGASSDRCFPEHAVLPKSKYYMVCDNCGKEYPRYKKPKTQESCSKCYPYAYNPDYLLRLEIR